MSRKPWAEYFLDIAEQVAARATCDRLHVGCVIVRDKQILATGYNGAPPGRDHCDDVGHMMKGGHCIRTVHAEANAIAQAAKNGTSIAGATAYVTHKPCHHCANLLACAGIHFTVWRHEYR